MRLSLDELETALSKLAEYESASREAETVQRIDIVRDLLELVAEVREHRAEKNGFNIYYKRKEGK